MIDIKDFHVGDIVWIYRRERVWDSETKSYIYKDFLEEASVIKTGKKYVYVVKSIHLQYYNDFPDSFSYLLARYEKQDKIKYDCFVDKNKDTFLFLSKQCYHDYMEYKEIQNYLNKIFSHIGNIDNFTLDQLRRIKTICDEKSG